MTLLANRYELLALAGQGGIATVWRGLMRGAAGFSRPVAVKKLHHELKGDPTYVAMFVEEARVGSELHSPNIVQVHDFCLDDHGSYYLIMEWVDGISLLDLLRVQRSRGEPLPWPLACAIGVGALRGLTAAHERLDGAGEPAPVIHRDVSPHNILLGVNGIAKLTDFGLARARDRLHAMTTAPGTIKGKLSYLAPEVTLGKGASPHSDIYAMGAVLWEALAGEPLFPGGSDLEVVIKVRAGEVPPLAERRDDLPVELIDAVHRALGRTPEERFASAHDMADALAPLLPRARWQRSPQADLGRAVVEARAGLGAVRAADEPPSDLHVLSDSALLEVPEGDPDNPILLTRVVLTSHEDPAS
ncbi:MAG TPA: serine/threonine-protein kinase [Kofleriaceae bacterium]|nr:serine/threonine-protein kinase [Kofleriaceae bacterium]